MRAGCADAPEEPHWWESGLRFVGGVFEGAGEAIWDLLTMVPFSPVNLVIDAYKLASDDLTTEELATRYELAGEDALDMAQGIYRGLREDPLEFGKNLGKSLLDWDTWADDPARALGHLVPDAIAAAATAGTGALATRGIKGGADLLDGLSDLSRIDNLSDLNKIDNGRHIDVDSVTGWSRGGPLDDTSPGSENYPAGYDRFGGLSEQTFYDRYWDPDARDGKGGWDYPSAAHGFADGFDGPVTANTTQSGDVVDRYGPEDGTFASPSGTAFDERALPPSSVGSNYTQYEVLRPLPDGVTEGEIAPWFEQTGGGLQYKFDRPITWYVENGYLRKLDRP